MIRIKAVFLDRDGTLNEDEGYVHKVEHLALLPGVVESLKRLADMGFLLFIVTNQSGIGRGYYSVADFEKFNDALLGMLKKEGIEIKETYMCPHTAEENCDCRKPKTKNALAAAETYGIDLSASYVIGDHPCDVELATNFGGTGVLVLTGHGKKHQEEAHPDVTVENITEAVDWIEHVEAQKSSDAVPEVLEDAISDDLMEYEDEEDPDEP